MQRREFLKSAAIAGGTLLWLPRTSFSLQTVSPAPDPQVKRVLVMFKCHFDAGFIDTQAHVVQRYFTEYFPHAIQIAEEMRQSGNERYVWTTGSWLLYEYLEQASRKTVSAWKQPLGVEISHGMRFRLPGRQN